MTITGDITTVSGRSGYPLTIDSQADGSDMIYVQGQIHGDDPACDLTVSGGGKVALGDAAWGDGREHLGGATTVASGQLIATAPGALPHGTPAALNQGEYGLRSTSTGCTTRRRSRLWTTSSAATVGWSFRRPADAHRRLVGVRGDHRDRLSGDAWRFGDARRDDGRDRRRRPARHRHPRRSQPVVGRRRLSGRRRLHGRYVEGDRRRHVVGRRAVRRRPERRIRRPGPRLRLSEHPGRPRRALR